MGGDLNGFKDIMHFMKRAGGACPRGDPGIHVTKFVCVEVLRPSQPNGVMSSAVSLPYHTFTGQA